MQHYVPWIWYRYLCTIYLTRHVSSHFSIPVLSEGFPVPNTTCDRIFPGRTVPATGRIQGPGSWEYFFTEEVSDFSAAARTDPQNHQQQQQQSRVYPIVVPAGMESLRCSSTLVPTDSQSITVVVSILAPTISSHLSKPSYVHYIYTLTCSQPTDEAVECGTPTIPAHYRYIICMCHHIYYTSKYIWTKQKSGLWAWRMRKPSCTWYLCYFLIIYCRCV